MSFEFFITYLRRFSVPHCLKDTKTVIFCKRAWSSLRRWNNVHTKSGNHVHETRGIVLYFEM